VPATAYLKQRTQAVRDLEAAYLPAIREFTKAKKAEEAEALEAALSGALKSARGYGLGVPDLTYRPPLVIENKAAGVVLESPDANGNREIALVPKAGRQRPLQCWQLNREEKGYTIYNAVHGKPVRVGRRVIDGQTVLTGWTEKYDTNKDTPVASLFQLVESRREVVISTGVKIDNAETVLAVAEKKQKGKTTYELILEKKEAPPKPNQVWVITEAR
jgi:hypothetical protein